MYEEERCTSLRRRQNVHALLKSKMENMWCSRSELAFRVLIYLYLRVVYDESRSRVGWRKMVLVDLKGL
jgi:hypothetical protein